jgi:acyl-CoA synthetase (NDP forming)
LDIDAYRRVFYPERLLLVGVTANPLKFGGMFLQTQQLFGFKGKIYPVNPKGGEIGGLNVYRKIVDVPEKSDLAVITVPASEVPQAVDDCIKAGVQGIQIISAGFKESSAEGKKLEAEIQRRTETAGVKLIGPNCFGVYSPQVGLTLLPGIGFPREKGTVGFFSQSGGGACDVVYSGYGRGVRFSLLVSFGNAAGIGPEEMLDYYAADPSTKIVGGYVEGIENGSRFLKALKACAEKKPVVILKAGTTELGKRGTIGHTGSLAGSGAIWQAAIRSAGAVQARDLRDMADCLMAFQCLPRFKGSNAGILAGGGARVVEALDAAAAHEFDVPELDDTTHESIQSLLPPTGARAANPVDLANPFLIPEMINPALEALAAYPKIDFLVLYQILLYSLSYQHILGASDKPAADSIQKLHQQISCKAKAIADATGKPLVLVLVDIASEPGHIDWEYGRLLARKHYTMNNIPCFDTGFQAFSVLSRVADYYRRQVFKD